jgi:uncharacterized integral membrane protein
MRVKRESRSTVDPDPVGEYPVTQAPVAGAPDPAAQVEPGTEAGVAAAPDYGQPPGSVATRPAVDPPLGKPQRTRMGGLWVALTSGAVVLLLLLIFILENGQKVDISFFGTHGHLPLGVALLMAAIFGVLMVVIPGAGRMIQLRLLAKRHRKQVAALPPTPVEPAYGQQAGTAPADPALAPTGYDAPADPTTPRPGT